MQLANLKETLGVELKLLTANSYSCRFCLLLRDKDLLHITQTKLVEGNLAEILAALPRKYPVALNLTGKGIMNKNIQLLEGMDLNQAFQHSFPAIDQNDFYIQQYSGQQNALLSIVRKQIVDDLYDKMQAAGLTVFNLSLGAIVTAPIWSQLNSYDQQLQFDGHFFELTPERGLLSYQFDATLVAKFPIKVAETLIAEQQLIAYAAAFQLLLHEQVVLIQANVVQINSAFSNFIANRKLKKRGIVFMLSLFVALTLSFILFSYYNDQNAEFLQELGTQTANADQTNLMQKNIAENEAILKQLNWNEGYNYGFLLNEIAACMPKQLNLTAVAMNDNKVEKEKNEFMPNIKIIGTTTNLTAVNNWIFELKEKTWVKSVNLLKYQEDLENDHYQFNLVIKY